MISLKAMTPTRESNMAKKTATPAATAAPAKKSRPVKTDSVRLLLHLPPELVEYVDHERGDQSRQSVILTQLATSYGFKGYTPATRGEKKNP